MHIRIAKKMLGSQRNHMILLGLASIGRLDYVNGDKEAVAGTRNLMPRLGLRIRLQHLFRMLAAGVGEGRST